MVISNFIVDYQYCRYNILFSSYIISTDYRITSRLRSVSETAIDAKETFDLQGMIIHDNQCCVPYWYSKQSGFLLVYPDFFLQKLSFCLFCLQSIISCLFDYSKLLDVTSVISMMLIQFDYSIRFFKRVTFSLFFIYISHCSTFFIYAPHFSVVLILVLV